MAQSSVTLSDLTTNDEAEYDVEDPRDGPIYLPGNMADGRPTGLLSDCPVRSFPFRSGQPCGAATIYAENAHRPQIVEVVLPTVPYEPDRRRPQKLRAIVEIIHDRRSSEHWNNVDATCVARVLAYSEFDSAARAGDAR